MRLPQSTSHILSVRPIHLLTIIILTIAFAATPENARASTKQLTCSPSSLRFGAVVVGQTESLLVTLTNNGTTSVLVSAMSSSNPEIGLSQANLPLTLPAGQSMEVSVIFTPTAVGWTGGTVVVTSNASDPILHLGVEGTGVNSEVVTASPSSVSFGQVSMGSSATLPVVLTNARSWQITLQSFQTTNGEFSVSGPSFPMTLAVGHSVTLSVSFAPQAPGAAGGSIFVKGPGVVIPLSGTGMSAGQLSINPTSTNFGDVTVGTTVTQPIVMSATGASVTISSAASGNSQFALNGASFPLTLAAGQSVSFNVAFSPTNSGTASGTLSISSNASNSQIRESLTGTGIDPQHTVDLSWDPSSSSVGYNVYRGPSAAGTYSKINSALDPSTTYIDGTVVSGNTYYYVATAVDSAGQESAYSTPVQAVVP